MNWNFANMVSIVKATLKYGVNGESVTIYGDEYSSADFTVGEEYNGVLQTLTNFEERLVSTTYILILFDSDDRTQFSIFTPEQVKEYWEVEPVFPD